MARIAVLLSGGVDSSVALARLHATGEHELVAFYLKIWLEDELSHLGACPWEEDLGYARAVTDRLGVPLRVVSLQHAYHERVVAHAVRELRAGRTPSPDIVCNAEIKFGVFFDQIGDDFDLVASGHYARLDSGGADGRRRLLRAPDPVKDQTYFLSRLEQQQLARLCFPIGVMTKSEVRASADRLGLANRDRPDSQGICFLGKIRYPEFVRAQLGDAPGDIVDVDTGEVLGRHRGLWYHTIGQRRGLGLHGGPWYVVAKDVTHKRVMVAHQSRYGAHQRDTFQVSGLHWIAGRAPGAGARLMARLRHGPSLLGCTVHPLDTAERLEVRLAEPDQGVAAGQSAVFYDGPVCLGQGIID